MRAAYLARRQTRLRGLRRSARRSIRVASTRAAAPALRPQRRRPRPTASASRSGARSARTGRRHVVGAPARPRAHLVASPRTRTRRALDGLAGGSADTPDVGFEDDSSFAWVVFRQAFDDGAAARSSAPSPAGCAARASTIRSAIDGRPPPEPSGRRASASTAAAQGIAAVEAPGGAALASVIRDDVVGAPRVLGTANGVAAQPVERVRRELRRDRGLAPGTGAGRRARGARAPARGRRRAARAHRRSAPTCRSEPGARPGRRDRRPRRRRRPRRGRRRSRSSRRAVDGRRLVVAMFDRAPGKPVLDTRRRTGAARAGRTLAWSDSLRPLGRRDLPGARRRPAGRHDDPHDASRRRCRSPTACIAGRSSPPTAAGRRRARTCATCASTRRRRSSRCAWARRARPVRTLAFGVRAVDAPAGGLRGASDAHRLRRRHAAAQGAVHPGDLPPPLPTRHLARAHQRARTVRGTPRSCARR